MALRKKRNSYTGRTRLAIEHNGFYPYLLNYSSCLQIRGYAARTIQVHDSAIRRFIVWCDDRDLHDPKGITPQLLERYQKHLFHSCKANGEGLSKGTQRSLLTALKTFFKWLTRSKHIPYNPAAELILPRTVQRIPRYILNADDIQAVMRQPDLRTPQGQRDRAILETLYSTGVRRTELIQLQEDDINIIQGTILIREGKGKKDRLLPVGNTALRWIETYRDDIRPQLVQNLHDKTLFLADYGEPFGISHLGNRVKRYLNQAGIETPGSCHLFRHAMATHMLNNGADIRFIQAMLGHSRLSTTEIYTRVSIEKLKSIHTATHPR